MAIVRGIIGANYGDEGKGTVVAHYTKHANGKVLNVLTNGGAQRAHSIVVEDTPIGHKRYKFQHFGSGTFYGADNYYSEEFILNPLQFRHEWWEKIGMMAFNQMFFYHPKCRWSTPWDMMANQIIAMNHNTGTCGMGIWETIVRSEKIHIDIWDFARLRTKKQQERYFYLIKDYYEKRLGYMIPPEYYDAWKSENTIETFMYDIEFFLSKCMDFRWCNLDNYAEIICENGQGLLLNSKGKDIPGTTPSETGCAEIIRHFGRDVKLHYVTRSYLTKHGGYIIDNETDKSNISSNIQDDPGNPYNMWQGEFRYAPLDLEELGKRIQDDCHGRPFTLEMTHIDEVDLSEEAKQLFGNRVNFYDSPIIK